MAVREIRLYGDPVLRTTCDEVTDLNVVRSLVEDLLDTTKLPGRAGVAAPQIGVPLRVFSYHVEGKLGYLINPVLISLEGEKSPVEEGCLSVPGLWHVTPRHPRATAQGLNLEGETVTVSGEGLLAQALQHECDHLDGRVYLDRLEPQERRIAMRELRESDWFL